MSERPVFNVAQLMKEPVGATRSVRVDTDLYDLVPELKASTLEQPASELTGPVRLMHVTNGILAQGKLSADATVACVRCLEPVVERLEIDLEETFVPTIDIVTGQTVRPEEEDRALWIDAHHILDLTEVLRQEALLAVPLHPVCREDCRGLCPTCGKNLNEGDCDCVAEPDPRWAALSDLLKDSDSDNNS